MTQIQLSVRTGFYPQYQFPRVAPEVANQYLPGLELDSRSSWQSTDFFYQDSLGNTYVIEITPPGN